MASLNFDATSVAPRSGGFPVVPPGKYVVHIVNSERRPNSKNTGDLLYLELEILEGPEAGNMLREYLNLFHPSEQTVQIARGTLSAICHSVGVLAVNDSTDLHARRMIADVRVTPPKGDFGAGNKIASYSPYGAPAPVAAPAAPRAAAPWRTAS